MALALSSDLRLAARSLRRSPGFVLTAVLMLGLAVGVLCGLYSVVRHVLLAPLPYSEPERLVAIAGTAPGTPLAQEFGLAREFIVHYAERSQLIAGIGAWNSFTNTLRVGERAERLWMSSPPASLFATLGVAPQLGRLPTPADREPVVLLTDGLWEQWFGRDPGVIGRSVELFGEPRTVIGVMPADFRAGADVVTLWITRHVGAEDVDALGNFGATVVARLKPGVEAAELAAELTALAKELPQRFGGSSAYADIIQRFTAVVRPLDEQLLGPFARPLWLLLGAAGLVLLIAGANLANLFLVRAQARLRELAVRRALGAGRSQLLRLQLGEAVLVGLLAGALASAIAWVTLPLLLQAAPDGIPRIDRVRVDAAALALAFTLALASALACGALPALRAAGAGFERLREGGRGLTTRQHWLRHGLVAGQTALALLLLVGAGLLLRSVHELAAVDPGYDPRDVYTFQFAPEQPALTDAPSWARFHQDFLQRLAALPGVQHVGLVENVPIDEGTRQVRARSESMPGPAESGALLSLTWTAGDYLRAMDIRVLAGRPFSADDHQGRGNILVSRRAAELLWPGQDAVGQRLQREGESQWETVVGVVEDVLQSSLAGTPEPLVYLPLLGPDPATSVPLNSPGYVIRSARAEQIAGDVRALVREIAPEAPIYRQYTLQQLVDRSTLQLRFTLLTMGLAAGMALVLGAIGLYGVLSCVVSERTREIGVRMALGAPLRRVRAMIVAQGTAVAAVGVIVGLLAAALLSRALSGLLFGVQALDWPTYLATAATMLVIAAIASDLPARRAARLDPMVALRRE